MKSGIYVIRNILNGRTYVGSAVSIQKRLAIHRSELRGGYHRNQKLQRAWTKYGELAFEFCALLICSKENRIFYEQRAIDSYDAVRTGYNIAPLAGANTGLPSPRRGAVLSTETKEKISAKLRGRKLSPEHVENATRGLRSRLSRLPRRTRSDKGTKRPTH